jgi:peptidyl-dipeptidase Dcp
MKKISIILILVIFILASCNKKNDFMKNDNPFLKTWDTPFKVPPFDQIQTQHYLHAFEEGIKQQNA